MRIATRNATATAALWAVGLIVGQAFAHGDVKPQPVDTSSLDPLGSEWRTTNPLAAEAGRQLRPRLNLF